MSNEMKCGETWIIEGWDRNELLYWSNTLGWCDRPSADVFTDEERHSLNLPVGGRWVSRVDESA